MPINDIQQASSAVAALPGSITVQTSTGTFAVKRLSWLQFELLWEQLAPLVAGILGGDSSVADSGSSEVTTRGTDPADAVLAQLASAPALLLSLAALTTGIAEAQLGDLPLDDVLAIAGAAVQLNFTASAGLRDFFAALGSP